MRSGILAVLAAVAVTVGLPVKIARADPDQTVRLAEQVLREVIAVPGKEIPAALLAQARGVAIIPNVIKIGFVAGLRRGYGVVLVRDQEGAWGLPQFVTLTGGSVGWQAGVQGSDVVLVFMTQKSIEGLQNGKFTIGADIAAAAGPVGRNMAAATDGRLKAEILSYSRSRGLFAGLALDGSAIEVDDFSHLQYYGLPRGQPPRQLPESASRLREILVALSPNDQPALLVNDAGAGVTPPRLTTRRESLRVNSLQLFALLDSNWQRYLALPRDVFEADASPSVDLLQQAQTHYARIAQSPDYRSLADRPEFQATHEALIEYLKELTADTPPRLVLPPPPAP